MPGPFGQQRNLSKPIDPRLRGFQPPALFLDELAGQYAPLVFGVFISVDAASEWCNVVSIVSARPKSSPSAKNSEVYRISVSFDPMSREELERMAAKNGVSIAWVVRNAVYDYIRQDNPLFSSLGVAGRAATVKSK